MKAIVTVKLPRNSKHNPFNKQTGTCPLCKMSNLIPYTKCTDVTGEHHSYIEEGRDEEDIKKSAKELFGHVTRIEIIEDE